MVEEFNLRPHGSVVVSARAIDSQELLKFTRSHTHKKSKEKRRWLLPPNIVLHGSLRILA